MLLHMTWTGLYWRRDLVHYEQLSASNGFSPPPQKKAEWNVCRKNISFFTNSNLVEADLVLYKKLSVTLKTSHISIPKSN
jgi:hypothetical protein